MSKSSKRTGGEWKSNAAGVFCGLGTICPMAIRGSTGNDPNAAALPGAAAANAHTIALAGTTANKLDALGFDGDACIEALPEIMAALERLTDSWPILASDMIEPNALLSRLRPAKGGER